MENVNATQPTSAGKKMSTVASALGVVAIVVAGLSLALDKSLPYRIGPNHYGQYLWVGRPSMVSLVTSVVTMLFSVASRRGLPFLLGLVSLGSLFLFMGGVHSGPNPQAWCVINLRNIEGSKQQVVQEVGLTSGAVVSPQQISKFINREFNSLRCAEGGQYAIGTVGSEPRCSVHGSMSEIEAGWKRESLKYLQRTGDTNYCR